MTTANTVLAKMRAMREPAAVEISAQHHLRQLRIERAFRRVLANLPKLTPPPIP